jgi:Trk K+ transport system NAD-binding subunit
MLFGIGILGLLSAREGDDFYKINVPSSLVGENFIDIFIRLKKENKSIVLGIQKSDGQVFSNPDENYILEDNDQMILIAREKPEFQKG